MDEQAAVFLAAFVGKSVPELARDSTARAAGERLFLNYCAACHGSDARGAVGFPDLSDDDWLYGGSPEAIVQSIRDGRTGAMPALGAALDGEQVLDVANYVRSLSSLPHDAQRSSRGATPFQQLCAACHGADGRGLQALGSANLTDSVWLHGSSEAAIVKSVREGRSGVMPPHKDWLDAQRIDLLAAYVYGLANIDSGR